MVERLYSWFWVLHYSLFVFSFFVLLVRHICSVEDEDTYFKLMQSICIILFPLCWRNSCFRVLFFYKLIVLFSTFIENLPLRTHHRVSPYIIQKSPSGKIHIAFQPEGLIYNSIGHRPLHIDYCHCMPPIAW